MQGRAEQGMGLNYRRRVVYRALSQCFADEARARRYFTLWNREFAGLAHVALARYISAVVREGGLDADARGHLQRALYEGLGLRYEQLARVPDDWMPAANHTGEFPALPAAGHAPAASEPAPAPAIQVAHHAPPAGPREVRSADASLPPTPAPSPLPLPPAVPPDPLPPPSAGAAESSAIERADRGLFRVLAAPFIDAIREDTEPHPGLLEIALADLEHTLEAGERPAHARLAAWAGNRFLDRDMPVMADIDGYRAVLSLLRRLVADLDGDAVANRLLAAALVRAQAMPQARICPPQHLL